MSISAEVSIVVRVQALTLSLRYVSPGEVEYIVGNPDLRLRTVKGCLT